MNIIFSQMKLQRKQLKLYVFLAVLTLIEAATNVVLSFFSQMGIDAALTKNYKFLLSIGALMFGFILLYAAITYLEFILKEKLRQAIVTQLRNSVLMGILNTPLEKRKQYSLGAYQVRMIDDVDTCSHFITEGVFPIVKTGMTILLGIIYVFKNTWEIGIIGIMVIPAFFAVNQKNLRLIEEKYHAVRWEQERILNILSEAYKNLPVLKVFQMHNKIKLIYENAFYKKKNAEMENQQYHRKLRFNTDVQLWGTEVLCIVIGLLLCSSGRLSMGGLLGVTNAFVGSIVYSVIDLPEQLMYMAKQLGAWERVKPFIDGTSTMDKTEETERRPSYCTDLFLSHLQYDYDGKPVLKDISACFKQGELSMIMGESGQGKTTLIWIILGILKPKKGKIFFTSVGEDSKDVNEMWKWNFQKEAAYLAQENTLLELTLRENLQMGHNIDDGKLWDALRRANIADYVKKLAKGLDSVIGTDAIPSIGESQRILLARAIAQDKTVIVLDEPFSALDTGNIRLVMKTLSEIKTNKVIIVVSHYEGCKGLFDKIYRMKEGYLYEEKKE